MLCYIKLNAFHSDWINVSQKIKVKQTAGCSAKRKDWLSQKIDINHPNIPFPHFHVSHITDWMRRTFHHRKPALSQFYCVLVNREVFYILYSCQIYFIIFSFITPEIFLNIPSMTLPSYSLVPGWMDLFVWPSIQVISNKVGTLSAYTVHTAKR